MRVAVGSSRWIAGGAVTVAAYGLVVVGLTWPLAARLTTHLPAACGADCLLTAWVLAHETHALTTAPAHLLDANTYFPAPHTLFYGVTAFGALPWFAPVFLMTGNPALALNVTWLAGLTLTAWTLHVVVRRWTESTLAGAVAAATFLGTPWVWSWTSTAPFYALLLYLPLIVAVAADGAGVLGLAALVVLQCLVEPLYLTLAIFVPLGVLAAWRTARRARRGASLRLVVALGLAAVVLLPVYAGYLGPVAANPGLRRQSAWGYFAGDDDDTVPGLYRLRGVPYVPMSLPWGLVTPPAATAVPRAAFLVILLGGVSLALHARTRRPAQEVRAWKHAAGWAAAGALMSLRPVVLVLGRTVWLPHLVLIARLSRIRIDYLRLGVVGLIGLALLAGLAFAECVRRLPGHGRWRRVASGVLALALAAGLYAQVRTGLAAAFPVEIAIAPRSPLVQALRASSGPVLELPLGRAGISPGPHARAMYRSIFHWRPLLNGYGSYFPAGFAERMAVAERLPDASALATLAQETGLATVVVHTQELPPAERAAWRAVAEGRGPGGLTLAAADGTDLVFGVDYRGAGGPPTGSTATAPSTGR